MVYMQHTSTFVENFKKKNLTFLEIWKHNSSSPQERKKKLRASHFAVYVHTATNCTHQNDAGKQWRTVNCHVAQHRFDSNYFEMRRLRERLKSGVGVEWMNLQMLWMYWYIQLGVCLVSLFPLRSGSVKNHWKEIFDFVENLAEKFKR